MRFLRANGRPPCGERGEVTWVGVVLLLIVCGAAYLGWVWIPVYWLHQDVERIVRETGNAAVKQRNDAALVADMTGRLRALAVEEVLEPSGDVKLLPAVDVAPEDVVWQREGDRLHVSFSYTRDVLYPGLDRRQQRVLNVDLSLDVSQPNWGKK